VAKHLCMAPSGMACDTRDLVCLSLGMVQIGIAETGGFYEVDFMKLWPTTATKGRPRA
jgi:hypothetical protein